MLINKWNWCDAGILYETDAGGSGGDNNKGAESGNAGEMSAEQLKAELERTRTALKAANKEAGDRRKRLDEIEAADAKRKEQELSDAQKAAKRAEEAEAKATQLEAQYRATTIRHAVEMAAAKLNFADPDDAYKLSDLSAITIGDDGKVDGVDAALKALSTAKPHLVKQAQGAGDINARNQGKQTNTTKDAAQSVLDRAYARKKE